MIKRILAAVLCMVVMFSGTVFVSASADGSVIINCVQMNQSWIEIEDEFGDIVEKTIMQAYVNLTNNHNSATVFAPFIAFYSGGKIVDVVKAEEQTIEKGQSGEVMVDSEAAYIESADACKVFVFDDKLVPYAEVAAGSYGNTVVSNAGARVETVATYDLIISDTVGDGEVSLCDMRIRGDLIIEGGGSETIKIEDSTISGKIIARKKVGKAPRIELTKTPVEKIEIETPAIVESTDGRSAIQEIVVFADAEIRGENTQVDKIVIDESADEKVELKVPATLRTEVEVNSVNGVDFGDADTGNITFSTTNVENADEILNQIKDYTEHMHVWTEQEIALGYNMVECNGCDEGKNRADKVISFTFDEYVDFDYDTGVVEYMPTDGDDEVQTAAINVEYNDTDFIIYNGLEESSKFVEDYIGDYGYVNEYNTCFSGKVTLIDNDGNDDYDVVCIEVPTYGVVDEVGENGRLWFKNDVETLDGEWVRINFKDSEQTIYLTKDGEEIDYTELSEGDVLSILWNPSKEVYYVDVLNNKIEGIINWRAASTTSATGYEYSINGEVYDVVYGAYGCESLKPGAEGTFYIDDYGKIVAYRKFVNENYGYILNSCVMCDDWGNENVKLQMLASDGGVYEATLAERVKIEYPESVGLTAEDLGYWDYLEDSATYDIDDIDMDTFADAIRNQLIAYEMNSSGEVKTITFYQADEDEDSPLYYRNRCGENVTYNARYDSIKYSGGYEFDVTEDTIVFFINNAENNVYTYGEIDGVGSKKYSAVATKDKLSDSVTYDYGMFFNTQEDVAEIIVLYNTSIEVEGPDEEITSGYGYILNSCMVCDDWGNETVLLQILASDGEVYEATFAEDFTIANPQEAELEVNEKDMEAVTYAVRNKLIAYEMNAYGEIVTVTFCTGVAGQAEVNDGKTRITVGDNEYSLTEGTIVFFVNNSSSNVYDGDAVTGVGSKACSTVETRDKLVSGVTYDCGVVFSSQHGVAEAIVIYNTSVEVGESNEEVTSGYGYILNSCVMCDDWDNENVMLQMLADDGEVYETTLAQQVKVEYPESAGLDASDLGADILEESGVYDRDSINLYMVGEVIINKLISYEMNSSGEIITITFPQYDDNVESLYLGASGEGIEYDGKDAMISVDGKKYGVAEDAVVFYINNYMGYVYDGYEVSELADKDMSNVGARASLADGVFYEYGQIYNTQDEEADIVVVYNKSWGGNSASSGLAVIDMVCEAVYNGKEVFYIKYYMDGKLCEAYTDVNYYGDLYGRVEQGDLYKFAFSADGKEIVDSMKFGKTSRVKEIGEYGAVEASLVSSQGKQEIYFGPVVDVAQSTDIIKIASRGNGEYNFIEYKALKVTDANIYVYNPNKLRSKDRLRIGELSNVCADKNIINHAIYQQDNDESTIPYRIVTDEDVVNDDELALGMMDFVIVFEYDDTVKDIVVYKGYDFGAYQIN